MKKGIHFLLAVFLFNALQAQTTWSFAGGGGSSGPENCRSICTDAAGNVYITGSYSNTVDFDFSSGGTYNMVCSSGNSSDIFIASYTSAGAFRWAVSAGSSTRPDNSSNGAICTDGTYVYATGSFGGQGAVFGSTTLNSNGGGNTADVFVAKLSASNGAWQWATSYGGTSSDNGYAICIDPSSNIYIAGNYSGTFNGCTTPTSSGSSDIFVAKINPSNGACVWVASGGSSAGGDAGTSEGICYVPAGKLVLSTEFSAGNATYGSYIVNWTGGNDIAVVEIDASNGNFLNAIGFGTANNDDASGCTYDASTGDVFISGYYDSGALTVPNGGSGIALANLGLTDIWLGRYSMTTHNFVWAKNAGGSVGDINQERAFGICSDGSGTVAIAGSYLSSPSNFGSLSLTNATGFGEPFIAGYSASDGTALWVNNAVTTNSPALFSSARAIANQSGSGNYWLSGNFSTTTTFGSLTALTSSGFNDLYIAKISAPVLAPLVATQSQVNLTCNGVCTGSATVVASGGTSPYTYSWSPSGGSGATASSLCATTYTCVITDAASASISKTFNITQPTAITLNANSQTNVSCFGGSNGAASATPASGGTGAFTYNWTPGNPTGDGTVSVTGLIAGTWTCVVTDANSCTATQTFNITQPPAIVVTPASQTNVSCFGGSNGAASINTPTGGAGGFTYNWTPGNPTGDGTVSVTGLTAGTWTCNVTDANSCTATQTFNVTQPSAIVVTPASQTNISCFGGSNGAASINTPTGGAGGFTYNWTPGNPTGDGTVNVTGLSAGTWTCNVTDANSCTATQTFNVTQPSAIVVTPASQTNISCFGGTNGAASINTPTGGGGGFTYNWTPGNPTGDGTVSVTGLSVGTWTCNVTDLNGCTGSQSFTLTQPLAITVSPASQTNVSCFGGSNGAASINTPTGGAGGFTYNWTPGNPTGDGTVSVTGLTAGSWTCTVTDANSCTRTQTFNITAPLAIVVTPASQTNVACFGGSNGAASINTPTGGAGGFTYNWTPGNPTGDGTVSVTGLTAGPWTCTVTDANSCTSTQTFNITAPPAIVVTPASQTNVSCNGGTNGAASINTPTGGAGGFTYDWAPGNPTGDGTVSITGLTAGSWTCTITDANSCTATQTFNITQSTALVVSAVSQSNISCNGGSNGSASVSVSGGTTSYSYNWTPGNPTGDGTASVTGLSAQTYTCTVTDANSCTSTATFNITSPAALVANFGSQTNVSCFGGTNGAASVSVSGGTTSYSYNWTPGNPTGDGTASVTGLTAGSWTCTVTDANSCTATRTFTITAPPAISVTPASQTNVACFGGNTGAASVNTPTGGAGGFTYNWTPGNPTGDGTVSVTGLTAGSWTCTITDANSCTATQTFNITQTTALSASTSTTSTSCSGNDGTVNLTASGGTPAYTYLWSTGAISEDISNIAAGTYTATITDANSCTATASATVSTSDNIPPVANCQNVTRYLNAAGSATVTAAEINNGSTDDCGVASLSLNITSFTCANVGVNPVALTVSDISGNSTICGATVTILDTIRPVAICQNITQYLNAAGTATITASQVNNGSSDACGIATLSVSPSSFTCANVGANTVILTVTDNNGNITTCNATVTIADTIRPVAICQNLTRYLNAAGTASVTASQVNNGSSDACGIATLSVSPSAFSCANVGANTVTLTVTDNNGNTSTCNATVTVVDTIRPVANCQNVTRYLNAAGSATVTPAQINNGSSDACGVASLSLNITSFTCANVGANTVALTVTDNNGNTSACSATVTILDTIRPVAICQNITQYLNAAGTATITASQVNNGSNDACGIATVSVSPTSFTCANVGANTVTLTVTDNNGNTSACSATVTILDTIRPVAICQNITQYLNAAGTANITASQVNNGSSDACGIASLSVSPSSFTCANVGTTMVTLSVTDNNGNTSNCNAIVTILDTISPLANCQNITAYLNGSGTATITAAQVNNGSSDACGIASLSLSNTSFTCANVGANTVALTVTDNNGNTSTCSAIVTITDTIHPVASCQNITTYLDAGGNATVTATQVNSGSTDACGIATLSLDVTAFDCNDVGANTVVLTVTDVNGNASACSAIVTVVDTIAPVATCQNITVQLDANGTAAITSAQVDNGSADVCSNATLSVSPNSFTCANIGANTVTLTVTDVNGNTSTCNATVTIEDTIAPVATCQNITTYLDANGNAAVTASQVNNGSSDACGIATVTVSPTSFTCANVGANTVTLTETDNNGNVSTCTATVTVIDTIAPVATCQNITTYLDANGNATVTAAQINNGSTDACGVASLAVDVTAFDCSDIGANTVVLTVTDANGNASACTATVTVIDTIAPVAICQSITVQLDANGNATISAADIDNGSTDACGIATRALDITAFDCSDIGANTVVLTVTDVNGNASACTATVTVADTIAPVAICQSITTYLDANGNATVTAAQINNGSTDDCGIASVALDITAFGCSDIGANTVVLTVTDVSGNTSTCTATVTVEDTIAPAVACQSITVQLDAAGNASITAAQIDNGSADVCGNVTLSVTPGNFDCLSVGANTVTLTATDVNGNSSSCIATVTVVDTVAPVTVCRDITAQLDANGNATITAADVTNPNSFDACGISTAAIDVSAFDCSNVGANTVTLTLTDINGNTSSCIATVTVEDTAAPVAICHAITVQLDANGSVAVSGAQVNNGSTDLCGVASVTVSPNTFDCNNIGANTVTLTVTDNSGNVSTCTSTVTVEDTVAPLAVCQSITVQLDATGNATIIAADINNGSTDACGIATTSIDITDFDCSDIGTHAVTLTVTDVNGNTSTCSSTVTVADTIAPVAACHGLTVQLGANGNANITAAQIENSSTDACGVAATSIDITSFDCSNVGANTVTLTVTDVNGNSSTCTATVTVEDTTAPVASCRNITVQLDASGSVTVTGAQVDNGSIDLCGAVSLAVSPNTFNCSNIGVNTVTLTVTDASGNTSTCTATVTVEDTTAPTAICQNISVALSAAGTASITAAQINNGSIDACGIATVTVSPANFTCANTGANNVTLTVTDVNGNTSTCTAVVTVTASGTAVGSTLNQTVCSGLAYNFNGQLLTASGTYYDTLATVNGCDSIVTLNLTISFLNTSNISASICPSGFYNFYGEVLTDAGVYTDTVSSTAGCDTIVTLTLTETPVSNDATVSGNVCTATQAGATYQWYTCNTGQLIPGATSQSYTATQPGNYQCLVTLNGCAVSTFCVHVNPVDIADVKDYKFSLYPNPNAGTFVIQHNYTGETEVVIENMLGQRIKQFALSSTTGYFDISDYAEGIYNVVVISGNERLAVIKVVKQ